MARQVCFREDKLHDEIVEYFAEKCKNQPRDVCHRAVGDLPKRLKNLYFGYDKGW